MAKRKPYRFFLYLGARFLAGFFSLLPRPLALKLAGLIGRASYDLALRQRKNILENLRQAYAGEKSEDQIQEIAARVLEHAAKTAVEVTRFPKLNQARVQKLVDLGSSLKVYRELLAEGKGLISISAHLGNWELLAAAVILEGFPAAVVGRRLYYEPYDRWLVSLRRSLGVRTIYRDQAAREILGLLKKNGIVGLVPDQDVDSLEGVYVDFFGRPAYTPVAPVRLALITGAPLLVNFLIREPDDRYRVILGEVLRPRVQTTREEAIQHTTAAWMKQVEKVVRQYPEQWAWMHHRWKTQPERRRTAASARRDFQESNPLATCAPMSLASGAWSLR